MFFTQCFKMHNLQKNLWSDLLAELVTHTILNIRQKEKESVIKPKLLECKNCWLLFSVYYLLKSIWAITTNLGEESEHCNLCILNWNSYLYGWNFILLQNYGTKLLWIHLYLTEAMYIRYSRTQRNEGKSSLYDFLEIFKYL